MAAWMEVAMDECVSGKEVLRLPRRFETLHLPLASSCWPMRVFRAIIQISTLPVFNFGKQLAVCHAVTLQFVGHDHPRHILKAFQQPAKESFGRVAVSPRLNED